MAVAPAVAVLVPAALVSAAPEPAAPVVRGALDGDPQAVAGHCAERRQRHPGCGSEIGQRGGVGRRAGDDDAGRTFAEQRHVGAQRAGGHREGGAERRRRSRRQRAAHDAARDAAFGEGHRKAAFGAIVGALYEAGADAVAQQALERLLELQVDVGHPPFDAAIMDLLVFGAVEPGIGGRAEQRDDVAFVLEARVAVL